MAHPIDSDTGRPAHAAGKCGRVMLDVSDVDYLVFKSRHLIPWEPALRGREIERINASVNHAIAIVAVFEEFVARERITSLGWTFYLRGNSANELSFVAMPRPWSKPLLILLQVKMANEKRVVRNPPESSGAIGWVVPHLLRAFLDYLLQRLEAAWYWDFRADRTSMVRLRDPQNLFNAHLLIVAGQCEG